MMIHLLPLMLATSSQVFAGPQVGVVDGQRTLLIDGAPVLTLHTPWVATGDWQRAYYWARDLPEEAIETETGRQTVRTDEGEHGRITETTTTTPDSVTIRYEFAFADIPDAAHIQWFWRLDPEAFDGANIQGQGAREFAMRPIEGAHINDLRQVDLLLPALDLSVEVSAADGEWSFNDQRRAEWAECYRIEYNRSFDPDGRREGWIEATIRGSRVGDLLVPLTGGAEHQVRGVPMQVGPLREVVDRRLKGALLWHTVAGEAAPGAVVGEVEVVYEDDAVERIPVRWEEALTSPTDDPRDLSGGALAPLPDGTPAWLSAWRNPRPEARVRRLVAVSHEADWRLVAAVGLAEGAGGGRVAMMMKLGRGRVPLAEETAISLDGTWRFAPEGGEERDIPVPSAWDQIEGLRHVHRGTYRRAFDIPGGLEGRRILLRFGAVGDFCEVTVDGRYAGECLSPMLPFEIDITGLVEAPSEGHELEVAVKDDTHFSVPRPTSDWRDRRHWIPRGIGGNNRKGLYRSVSLVGRPPIHIANVRIQTSVRKHELTVIWEFFNCGRSTVTGEVAGSVRPHGGGGVVLEIPPAPVEIPGFTTRTVRVTIPWEDPELWQPDHPTLYDLRSILRDSDGERLHRTDTRFGFREAWFEGIHFYLNGIRCNLRGESPSFAQLPAHTREETREFIRRCLELNWNVLRFHAIPGPVMVYDVCDELGMMVIDESGIYASWGMIVPEHPRWMPECRRHLERWVRRDRNHPSILLWSAENEGLNVSQLSPAQLAEFKRVIDAHDGTRPVIFDGDGTAYGATEASVKHYVRTISDLEDRGGKASGYGRDLRDDIYWAAEYKQDVPLGCGEFLFPANEAMKDRGADVLHQMGLQTRGYRYADWFDIRPYNPSSHGLLAQEDRGEKYEQAYDIAIKSFAPVAVFDKDYDALGPFPDPPRLAVGATETRTLIAYNDTLEDETVVVTWEARLDGERIAGEERTLQIPLGYHVEFEAEFTPEAAGELALTLVSSKGGEEQYRDVRRFVVGE